MQRQWIKSVEMIHTAHQTTRNEFTAPTHWQQLPIHVSISDWLNEKQKSIYILANFVFKNLTIFDFIRQ